jgi:hypothetical protein
MSNAKRRYWIITGYDSTTLIFRRAFPLSRYSEHHMADLLRTLAACSGELTLDEICGAIGAPNRATSLLKVQHESQSFGLSCGINPYFTTRVLAEGDPRLDGLIEEKRRRKRT